MRYHSETFETDLKVDQAMGKIEAEIIVVAAGPAGFAADMGIQEHNPGISHGLS
jgi:hypothetical protein